MRESLTMRSAWRTDAIAALQRVEAGQGDEAELRRIAKGITGPKGDPIWAYTELLDALAQVVPWKHYIRTQDPRQATCRAAAALIAADALDARQPENWWPPALEEAARALAALETANYVTACAAKLSAVPLPPRATTATHPDAWRHLRHGGPAEPALGPVSIRLTMHGALLPVQLGMKPGTLYPIDVSVQWPAGQVPSGPLRVRFKHGLPERALTLGEVELAPGGLSSRTYFELHNNIASNGSPEAIEVRASLLGGYRPIPVDVIGFNRFEIATHDPTHDRPFGAAWGPKVDEMLQELRQRLPGLSEQIRNDFITIFEALCDFAQMAITRRLFPDGQQVSEKAFQAELLRALLKEVGHELQEGSELAGGETDLQFRAITVELKVEKERAVDPANVSALHRQPAHYGAARACPLSILCVLDTTPKTEQPGVLTNYMAWSVPSLHGVHAPTVPTLVAVLVIPVGFGAPHDGGKSKTAKKRRRSG